MMPYTIEYVYDRLKCHYCKKVFTKDSDIHNGIFNLERRHFYCPKCVEKSRKGTLVEEWEKKETRCHVCKKVFKTFIAWKDHAIHCGMSKRKEALK